MADVDNAGPLAPADALRVEAHALREMSRTLARQALEARLFAETAAERSASPIESAERAANATRELQRTVEALVVRLRELGQRPDTLVVAMKAISAEAAKDVDGVVPLERAHRLALTHDLVRWAVRAYHAAEDRYRSSGRLAASGIPG